MKKPRFFDDIIAGKPDGSYLPYGRKLFRIDKFLHFQFAVGSGRHCITAEKAAAEGLKATDDDKKYAEKADRNFDAAMDDDFNTNIANLHCLGDSSGWTRGLMMASVMGVLMARKLKF